MASGLGRSTCGARHASESSTRIPLSSSVPPRSSFSPASLMTMQVSNSPSSSTATVAAAATPTVRL
ncbi:unnamed protein product [Protopolystoma xenopodis]|uniref:Uncharacterized protein n=1 Tax=Protopolystoma xenopodis TaxID=117903 RepID=A0A3S5BNK2_9PLAT|nr:unnamed protein product [Protopolystoma xenopodis]